MSTGTKVGALLAGVVALGILGVFLAFGFILLLGLAAVAVVLGVGAALSRKLSGRAAGPVVSQHGRLDPRLEVNPPTVVLEQREANRKENRTL